MSFEISYEDKRRIFEKYQELMLMFDRFLTHDQVVHSLTFSKEFGGFPMVYINELLLEFGIDKSISKYYLPRVYCAISGEKNLRPYHHVIHLKRSTFLTDRYLREVVGGIIGFDEFEKFFTDNQKSIYTFELFTDKQDGDSIISFIQEQGFVYFDFLGLTQFNVDEKTKEDKEKK